MGASAAWSSLDLVSSVTESCHVVTVVVVVAGVGLIGLGCWWRDD